MSFICTDERLLRHLRHKHSVLGPSSADQVVVEPRHTALKARHPVAVNAHNRSTSPCTSDCRVTLYVKGHIFKSTQQTLCSVKGSRFSELLGCAAMDAGGRKLFIDRNGQAFAYILDYLRACRVDHKLTMPPEDLCSAVLKEARFFRLPGLVQKLQQAMATMKDSELQPKPPLNTQLTLDPPVKFATVHAAVSSHTPQLNQEQLQQLSQQVNQQVFAYANRGFAIKDVSSGMINASGEQAEAYVLFITILLSAKTPAVISTAELDSQLCLGAYDSQQVFPRNDSISSSTHTDGSLSSVDYSGSSPQAASSSSLSDLRQRLQSSIAPAVAFPTPQPLTPDMAPKHPHLLPAPRLGPSSAHASDCGAGPEQAAQNPALSCNQHSYIDWLHETGARGFSPKLQDGFTAASESGAQAASDSIPAQWQLPRGQQPQHRGLAGVSGSVKHDSPTKPSPDQLTLTSHTVRALSSRPNTLSRSSSISISSSDGGYDAMDGMQSDAQSSLPAILVTNDLFQYLPDHSQRADADPLTDDQCVDQWQAYSISGSQASLLSTSDLSGEPSSQQLTTISGSRHSMTGLLQSQCGDAAETCQALTSLQQSSMNSVSDWEQQQSQVFSDLFDTQLSQFLTTQEEALGVSAELHAPAAADSVSPYDQVLSAAPAASVTAHSPAPHSAAAGSVHSQVWVAPDALTSPTENSLPASASPSGSGLVPDAAGISMPGDTSLNSEAASRSIAAVSGSSTPVAAQEMSGGQAVAAKSEAVRREPLTTAVSTAQLEIMGWDMFADTLGTFRLLSESDSDAESTTNLLPEPAELGPITPEPDLHEPRGTEHWVGDESPLLCDSATPGDHADQHGPGLWHSQNLAHFDFPNENGDMYRQDTSPEKYVCSSPMSPLEWEYHAMMLNEHCLSERYPGMHSDAYEFDGRGCVGNGHSCVERFEECMTCYPCATCACYPNASLRPGRNHRKSVAKRLWAGMKAKASACIHPELPCDRYS